MIRGDASQVYRLSGDLSKIGFRTIPALRNAMTGVGEAFAAEWRDNVRETGGSHLPHLPDAITSELAFSVTSVAVEVGPETSKKQGKLGKGDEFGSINQPPHLNGLRALDGIQQRAEQIIDATVGHLFG